VGCGFFIYLLALAYFLGAMSLLREQPVAAIVTMLITGAVMFVWLRNNSYKPPAPRKPPPAPPTPRPILPSSARSSYHISAADDNDEDEDDVLDFMLFDKFMDDGKD
jgi:hypothetical protein